MGRWPKSEHQAVPRVTMPRLIRQVSHLTLPPEEPVLLTAGAFPFCRGQREGVSPQNGEGKLFRP